MSRKKHAGGAGPVTPVAEPAPVVRDTPRERATAPDPCSSFNSEHRLKAIKFQCEAAKDIAKTRAWESVLLVNLRPILAALVLVVAIVCGVQMPWEWALAGILGGAVTKA